MRPAVRREMEQRVKERRFVELCGRRESRGERENDTGCGSW
jgi:hypothetical protein